MTSVHRILGWLRTGVVWLLVAPIRAYQVAISPMTPATCKFHPTCSAYAVTSLRRHGPVKAFCWLDIGSAAATPGKQVDSTQCHPKGSLASRHHSRRPYCDT